MARRAGGARATRGLDPDLAAVVDRLRTALGTKVGVERRKRGGRITIEFYSDDDFERLTELLSGAKS